MKLKRALLLAIVAIAAVLAGCEPLTVLNPKGPQAEVQANDIMMSIWLMSGIVIVVFAMLAYMLIKFRSSKQGKDYEPPHIEGNKWVEAVCVGIPVLIVAYLSFVSVQSNYKVEATPPGYEDKEPLVVYASSSNWKWHFSYPEEDIETVNYLYIPTDRALEFKLYSFGPITSFWIPQLGGQKYAMADMVTTLHLAADHPGEFMGRNANFSGKGFAENTFDVTAMSPVEFEEWVDEVHQTADPITEDKFEELLEPGHLGKMTFTGTHLDFSPAPEGHEHHQSNDEDSEENHENHDEHEGHSDHSSH
ncbi:MULTISPECIES: cytochrome aa3 quinol oxidase subunit II [Cytobacillus]|uniref:cytochrome aa3 quinol oxidase subunit II n=1 Tax=Cytobacillus TaxID=2675230 RepID=UPI001CD73DC2|nr:cytochrome aa3 quinol oxidase subunit II [Cytobacillus kochii]MCA1026208.1 cytochrome aa3 quinol oxidase subunit II [Cytobacillus kochii]MCM3321193.1 cytochrome aa3 quinol oxidase subunit II [Cytobacillus kochii]MCM3343974.1 cytochrome aa3 quinol oxidase subunit II [Cytobacillus kochii]MDM5207821.1 cytochrome aa3 quinol oxidase subunit II [Cytobacillus kochii]